MKKDLQIQLHCTHFPGKTFGERENVVLAVQKNQEVIDLTAGDVEKKMFELPVQVNEGKDGTPNFLGPYVFGKTGDKFLYLVWLNKKGEELERFRRAKIKLNVLSWEQINQAIEGQQPLKAHIILTDKKGEPICASLKAPYIDWGKV